MGRFGVGTFWGLDVLGLGMFRGLGRFKAWDVCGQDVLEVGRFGVETFCSWDVLGLGRFIAGTLCIGAFLGCDILSWDVL